jgi:hypothetical protein
MSYSPRPVSCMNEYTASYFLIPRFTEILKPLHPVHIPILYWASREGMFARQSNQTGGQYKVIALYPRRPKTILTEDDKIYIKLNQSILDSARIFSEHGILVFAGAPMVTYLDELLPSAKCIWLQLNAYKEEQMLELNKYHPEHYLCSKSPDDLIELISSSTATMELPNLAQIIRKTNQSTTTFNRFWNMNRYRPVLFLVPCQSTDY